ncbi:MAG: hypothetical protein RLZ98_1823 [Pseudomonadota bacterium]|jgi:hypothetical protein
MLREFLISYDLADPALNRHAVATAIMALGESWARPLAQTWVVKTDLSATAIEEKLARLLDIDDGLLVQPVSDPAKLTNTSLRWFRQRRGDADETNVLAFPASSDAHPTHLSEPYSIAV